MKNINLCYSCSNTCLTCNNINGNCISCIDYNYYLTNIGKCVINMTH